MIGFLVVGSLLGIYVTLLLRAVLALHRDTPLVVFLMLPFVLQLTAGLLARKEKWSLRIHAAGMFVLCLVSGYFWSLASVQISASSGDAYTGTREFYIFMAEILGACQWFFVALMVVVAWFMRRKQS